MGGIGSGAGTYVVKNATDEYRAIDARPNPKPRISDLTLSKTPERGPR